MESTPGNTHSVTFFPPGNVFFGSMISTMHPLTTNTAAVLCENRNTPDWDRTSNLQLRRLTLYPIELQAHEGIETKLQGGVYPIMPVKRKISLVQARVSCSP